MLLWNVSFIKNLSRNPTNISLLAALVFAVSSAVRSAASEHLAKLEALAL